MSDTRFISFSGKGGSGKTTTMSLFLSAILRRNIFKEILVIDADPDANLSETLNIHVETTLGEVLDKRKKELEGPAAAGTKLRFLIWDSIGHGNGFDFLVMGHTTGTGCYCSVNSVLNEVLVETVTMYDLVLIDFDAGIEHFSRRSGNPSDTLIITCDPSRLSFDTAKRIKRLIEELALPYERQFLMGCRFDQNQKALFNGLAEEVGLEVLGMIAYDAEIATKNLLGEDLLSLTPDNPSIKTVQGILKQLVPDSETI